MKTLSPKAIAPPFARHSHGVEIPATARLMRTSGQLGLAADSTVPDRSEARAAICSENIRHILAEAGMGPADVCHISAYVTDRAHIAGYMAARVAFLADAVVLLTSTLVFVSDFTRPEFVAEVEVWAAAPKPVRIARNGALRSARRPSDPGPRSHWRR